MHQLRMPLVLIMRAHKKEPVNLRDHYLEPNRRVTMEGAVNEPATEAGGDKEGVHSMSVAPGG